MAPRLLLLALALALPALAGCTLPEPVEDLRRTLEDVAGGPAAAPGAAARPPPEGFVTVHYVDVGQGDAVVWELPRGSLVVVDCGPPVDGGEAHPVIKLLLARGFAPGSRIAALVASHGHLDHVGGCDELLEQYRVQHVYEAWYNGTDAPASYRRFLRAAEASGAQLHTLRDVAELQGERVMRRGDRLALPPEELAAGVEARLLWPSGGHRGNWSTIESSSLVVRLSFGTQDFCFQGDIGKVQERQLARLEAGHDCEVYLVGHHGSAGASSEEWLLAMAPEVAVASFGANGYGHPTSAALCRVQQVGAEVYATHRLGTVSVGTDGHTLRVSPDQPERLDYCAEGASYWS